MSYKVVLALPCYNEALNLPALLADIRLANKTQSHFKIIPLVINDCSTDHTMDVLSREQERMGDDLLVIHHEVNRGLTGGINSAFQKFSEIEKHNTGDYLAYGLMDGDNSHSPHVVGPMVQKILERYDVVVASRYQPGSRIVGVSYFRQLLSFGLALIFKMLKNIPGIRDYSCGFRLYSPRIIKKVTAFYPEEVVLEKSFASMVEILVKCHYQGAIMTEVPFLLRYDQKLGQSKMPFKKTILGNLKLLRTLKNTSAS